ncbi:restriction endonuclease [Intrasporangium calvum]|uniref:Restriction endonuclease n=1 Tax=Intrasporangium calvum TaxID=53358 RepID=A0ABT5GED9_9MICO|nr:restriction endonuclease [Intrasporangium calvum]MDC5696452.1 restriction endonuclease [Intrasporangium calvum]
MTNMWGIHNDAFGSELVEQGFISIGWEEMPDLRTIGDDRERMKASLERTYPSAKAGAIPVWAGILLRFAYTMQVGDIVVAPYRPDGTINFGVVEGPYEYHQHVKRHPHRRRVRWTRTGVSRGLFPQTVLYEIGSALTLFQVRKGVETFERFLDSESDEPFDPAPTPITNQSERATVWAEEEPNATRIEQYSRDFILRTLLTDLSHEEFEHFTADLLRTLGYQARVTPYASDGGIDVIAHRDPLGLEPPIIKVQCKHTTGTQSRPDVQRLIGTLSSSELGLFVTLGTYSRDALELERERQNLRLFSGADITTLTLDNYSSLPGRWRARLPLRQVLVVDREPEVD